MCACADGFSDISDSFFFVRLGFAGIDLNNILQVCFLLDSVTIVGIEIESEGKHRA